MSTSKAASKSAQDLSYASWNVNGIRSIQTKGFDTWLDANRPSIVCLQETKACLDQLDMFMSSPKCADGTSYTGHFVSAQKKGYSGLACFVRDDVEVKNVIEGFTPILGAKKASEFDSEGRVLAIETKDHYLVNSYFPNSQREHERLPYKLRFCDAMAEFLFKLKKDKPWILCGDLNIAHEERDLANPKTNTKNAGFLPEERAFLSAFLSGGKDAIDSFRLFETSNGHYTWWSYRPGVREKNIGWRLDYFLVDPRLKGSIKSVTHQTKVKGSDHCPVVVQL